MGCAPSKDGDAKARREANVRAALGAGDKPQPLKDRQRARDEKKEREREEADEPLSAMGTVPGVQPAKKPLPGDWTQGGGGKKSRKVETDSDDSEFEDRKPARRGSVGGRGKEEGGGGKKSTGGKSSEVVRGGLLEQLALEKERAKSFEAERDEMRRELIAVRDKEESEKDHAMRNKRHDKTEMEAYQEMLELANKKADGLEGEVARMKKALAEMFSPTILDQLFPKDVAAAEAKRKEAARKRAEEQARESEGGLLGGVFGMSKKPKLAKGTGELLEALQEQTKEIKELKRERERLKRQVSQWEQDLAKQQEESINGSGGLGGLFKGTTAAEWEDKFHAKARECDDLERQLQREQDAVRALRANSEAQGSSEGAIVEVDERGEAGQKGGFFSSLFKDDAAKDEAGEQAVQAANGEAQERVKLLEGQLEELEGKLQRAEEGTRKGLEEVVRSTASALASRQETCEMLADQRAGALEQLSGLQMERCKLEAELAALREGHEGELSDAQELQAAEQRVEALEEQVQDVVAANKDLFQQTAEAIEENNALNIQLQEQGRHCDRLEEALLDAQQAGKALSEQHSTLHDQVQELLRKDMARAAKESKSGADPDLAHTVTNLQCCVAALQSSKAVADTEARTASVWRSRCVEVEAQRDTALEIALCVSRAHNAEEANDIVRNYLG